MNFKTIKDEVFTIPNLLSFLRLALIPFILWSFIGAENYVLAAILVVISSISDIADGIIARKFNMTSEVGKLLDPVADKMTQGVLLLCLSLRYPLILLLVAVFILKEIVMIIFGFKASRKNDAFVSSKWYGKANTVIVEGTILALVIFVNMSKVFATILIIISICSVLIATYLYYAMYKKYLANGKK